MRRESSAASGNGAPLPEGPAPGPFALALRLFGLRSLEGVYRAGAAGGAAALLAAGGFVPVLRAWLADEVADWDGAVRILGGVRVAPPSRDLDADHGPALARSDAPGLFGEIEAISRRLGVRRPEQVRITYLPCCGVTASRRARALVLGLPLLDVLTVVELRAALAHELAHLAHGDATRTARSVRFVEGLARAIDREPDAARGPLGAWARACRRLGESWLAPAARGQELRADRASAALAGGPAAASALVKVALVQSLFREVLAHYDPAGPDQPNLYAFFRDFWTRLPESLLTALRHRLLASAEAAVPLGPHPSLLDRIGCVQGYPQRGESAGAATPASHLVGDLESLEQMLHNRLFAVVGVEPSVFHRAGS